MKWIIILLCSLVLLLSLSFVPLWPEQIKGENKHIKVNTWTKLQLNKGEIYID